MACGCGLIGSLVLSPGTISPVYSSPAPRGGAAALFSFEVLEIDASVGLAVQVEHKNRGDTSWTQLAAFSSAITTTGVHSLDMNGFKQQYRVSISDHSLGWIELQNLDPLGPQAWPPAAVERPRVAPDRRALARELGTDPAWGCASLGSPGRGGP